MIRMLRRALLVLAVGVAAMPACGDDPNAPAPPPGKKFEDLTSRSDVLNNLELAYNKRNITRYDEILDNNFTFFLTPADVGGGLPQQWGRVEERQYTGLLFAADPGGGFPRCKSILMDVSWEDGLTWQAVMPPSAPGETWYTTTAFYDFTFEFEPDSRFINNPGAKAQFTVRNAATGAAPHWQLVEIYDRGDANLRSTLRVARVGTTNESMTWGGIKALYR